MDEARAIQFLSEVRKPLLNLHKAILDHERAEYEREFGPTTPAAFLQVLINGTGFRWLMPFSTVIANVDETLDAKDAQPEDRIGAVEGVTALFSGEESAEFFERYQALLRKSPDVLQLHGVVAQLLNGIRN
ncbi:hypothetical protein B0G62_11686 [Paraburkholderia eburnea]|uniref:Uncharacterized protein n=1 Tax=Paraburkholderia eburnea TaxID=1189126 RepID=A0A2S4LZU7_9BURK|nr:hypothetical protein [Paraburkholderia eburnea]POR47938.1 hypothetical protein B0G62_11686 [Paraburkholderia eburnea]PRZ19332.1 hypothetical protein BX588_11686 [Paraburkholderia eburnea]